MYLDAQSNFVWIIKFKSMLFKFIHENYGGKRGFLHHVLVKIKYLLYRYTYIDDIPDSLIGYRIVFVCKGNICRSALAHCYLDSFQITETFSFGLETKSGLNAYDKITSFSNEIGCYLAHHRTTSLSDYKFQNNDFIYCMEPSQCKQVKQLFPNAKVSLLGLELRPIRPFIQDPYEADEEYIKTCIILIVSAINSIKLKLSNHTDKC